MDKSLALEVLDFWLSVFPSIYMTMDESSKDWTERSLEDTVK